MPSEPATGAILRHLANRVPDGRFLELGTGTGIATSWILSGMDASSRLVTVDSDPSVLEIASRHLSKDPRLTIIQQDGALFLEQSHQPFDFIFADAWPGKFSHLDRALALLDDGAIYIVDDLLPQRSWPENHAPRVADFIEKFQSRSEFEVAFLELASGILIAQKL